MESHIYPQAHMMSSQKSVVLCPLTKTVVLCEMQGIMGTAYFLIIPMIITEKYKYQFFTKFQTVLAALFVQFYRIVEETLVDQKRKYVI